MTVASEVRGRGTDAIRRALSAHVKTWRPYTTCYPGLLGVAGAVVAGGTGVRVLLIAAVTPVLGWLAGHYLGDYFDRGLDAISKPHRPIPSGRLSPASAVAGGLACASTSALLLATANWRSLPFFVTAMAGIVGYSKVFKKTGLAGNVVRGLLTALALAIGAMVAAPVPPWALLPAVAGFLLHDMASNLVGTLRDIEGDRAGGYRSVPVRRGFSYAARLSAGLYVAGLVLVTTGAIGAQDPVAQLMAIVVSLVAGTAAFLPLLRQARVSPRAALRAHELLVAERLVLAGAVIAGATGPLFAFTLTAPVLAFSLVTQALMRSGHEFPVEEVGRR